MDNYQSITDRIVELLESGTVPWRKPWNQTGGPTNLVSKKGYRGINVFLLACSGYDSPYWLTFNQAKKLGGNVNKGQKSTVVIFWNWVGKKTDSAGTITKDGFPMLRYYRVFNVEQCTLSADSVPIPEAYTVEPITACESIVNGMPNAPTIAHDGNGRAFYRSGPDSVHMPTRTSFDKQAGYYSTLFHELAHSTGHKSRLNRSTLTEHDGFGGDNYSREELVAEMSAAFLCGVTGIETATIDNSAAYIKSWIRALIDDKQLVVSAAGQAQKAADYIQAKQNPIGH